MNNRETRRDFLLKLSLWLGAATAFIAGLPVLSAILEPLIRTKQKKWRTVGSVNDFAVGSTTLVKFVNAQNFPWGGITDKSAAWLRREEGNDFIAFSIHCTHLGCPLRWEEKAQLFMCPCHGGVYYKDGSKAAGPPPKDMVRYGVRINRGKVEILTSPVPITRLNE